MSRPPGTPDRPRTREARVPFLASTALVLAAVLSGGPAAAHVDITPAEAHARLAAGGAVLLLDVREYSEFCGARAHVADAVSLPWTSGVLQARVAEVPPDWDVIVTCASGGRSHSAATWLDGQGFPSVFDMQGGMSAWTFETEACAPEPLLFVDEVAGETRIDWVPASGAQDHDLARGRVAELLDAGAVLDLGDVACLERLTPYTWRVEAESPGPGTAWFYVVRQAGGDYGAGSDLRPREAPPPSCD